MEKMSEREWKRFEAVTRVGQGMLTNREAAKLLALSERQLRRLRRRVSELGAAGVLHGNRGRAPAHRIKAALREQIVKLRQGKYAGFNDQHFTEKLAEDEGIVVSRASVRRLLRAAGIGAVRPRRAALHRRRRLRKPRAGLMILWDGSVHRWLEERGPQLCLMAALDDATGEVLAGAHFIERECAAGYLTVLKAVAEQHGLPWIIYMDHHGSLARNDDHWSAEEQSAGVQQPTHVGRALAALHINAIYALSPQAKGRVERLWGTLQDRLVSELRLHRASSIAAANKVLQRFIPNYNRRFAVAAMDPAPAWRALGAEVDLARTCSFGYRSRVLSDNTVRLGGVVIDIAPGPGERSYARSRVEVRQLLDGSWRVYQGET
jgi:transposase